MKSFRKITSELIGFDRRERRGSYILSILLIILLLMRVFAFRPGTEPVALDITAPVNITIQDEAQEGEGVLSVSIPTLPRLMTLSGWVSQNGRPPPS
ncbi:MAG: hypothetical protein MZV63_04785 [Marinilabiliales bacterium]|nr:hypothetical protein [Marinilabiliales bacterium]